MYFMTSFLCSGCSFCINSLPITTLRDLVHSSWPFILLHNTHSSPKIIIIIIITVIIITNTSLIFHCHSVYTNKLALSTLHCTKTGSYQEAKSAISSSLGIQYLTHRSQSVNVCGTELYYQSSFVSQVSWPSDLKSRRLL